MNLLIIFKLHTKNRYKNYGIRKYHFPAELNKSIFPEKFLIILSIKISRCSRVDFRFITSSITRKIFFYNFFFSFLFCINYRKFFFIKIYYYIKWISLHAGDGKVSTCVSFQTKLSGIIQMGF